MPRYILVSHFLLQAQLCQAQARYRLSHHLLGDTDPEACVRLLYTMGLRNSTRGKKQGVAVLPLHQPAPVAELCPIVGESGLWQGIQISGIDASLDSRV